MAGGGKVSARQKMINMMYLVLTALLALNVSKEIIKAFNLIENSLDNSTKNINQRFTDTLNLVTIRNSSCCSFILGSSFHQATQYSTILLYNVFCRIIQ